MSRLNAWTKPSNRLQKISNCPGVLLSQTKRRRAMQRVLVQCCNCCEFRGVDEPHCHRLWSSPEG